jgi:predicted Zn-dependent peptidase
MRNSTFREFYPERSVVREERRMSIENAPTGRIEESFNALFWESSPYSWPTLGWPWDIENISREDIKSYYRLFYAPENAVGLFMGDFKTEDLLPKIRDYFERIPRSGRELPQFVTPEIKQVGEKRMTAEARANPGVTIRYHTRAFSHPDTYALEVLAELLSGKTGRLYNRLVIEKELALGDEKQSRMGSSLRVEAGQNTLRFAGYFEISAEAREGVPPEDLETNIYDVLQELGTGPVPTMELEKAKNQVLAGRIRTMKNFFGFLALFELAQCAVYGDWHEINEKPKKIMAVTVDDIRRVAAEYFEPSNRNVLIIRTLKEEEESPEKSSHAQAMIDQITQIDDPEELSQMINQMESMKARIENEEMARGIENVLAAAYERLETLKKGKNDEK